MLDTATTTPTTATDAGPRIGIAPDSWGVWNAVDPVQPPAEQYIREAAAAGFRWTEIGPYGYLGTDVGAVRAALDERQLRVSGGTVFAALHTGPDALDEQWDAIRPVAELVRDLGASHLVTIPALWQRGDDGQVRGHRTFAADDWTHFIAGHDALGKRLLEEFGLRQQFHSHAESAIGSDAEVTRLLEHTDPQYTNLCLDTGHFAYYLGDSVDLMRRFPERIGYLHLKQVDPAVLGDVLKNDVDFASAVQHGVMVEPPFGTPDFRSVLEAATVIDPDLFAIVEQDLYPVASFDVPLPIATRTFEHLTSCGVPVRVR